VVVKDTGLVSCWKTLRGGPLKKRLLPSPGSGIPGFTRERANFTTSSQALSLSFSRGRSNLHGLDGGGFVGGVEAALEVIELEAKGLHIHVVACAGCVAGNQCLFGEFVRGQQHPDHGKATPGLTVVGDHDQVADLTSWILEKSAEIFIARRSYPGIFVNFDREIGK
jgi:hypothetical protein